MASEVPKKRNKKVILVLDNASWHKAKSLNWHHIEPVYLPPYSPDFNPIERFW
jgi:transposase